MLRAVHLQGGQYKILRHKFYSHKERKDPRAAFARASIPTLERLLVFLRQLDEAPQVMQTNASASTPLRKTNGENCLSRYAAGKLRFSAMPLRWNRGLPCENVTRASPLQMTEASRTRWAEQHVDELLSLPLVSEFVYRSPQAIDGSQREVADSLVTYGPPGILISQKCQEDPASRTGEKLESWTYKAAKKGASQLTGRRARDRGVRCGASIGAEGG